MALRAGANDLGGVLMNESITRAAGGVNGQELDAAGMQAAIRSIGRLPRRADHALRRARRRRAQRSFGNTSRPMICSASIGSS